MADKCDAKFITDTYETFTCERPDDVHLRHRRHHRDPGCPAAP
ncbi:hypothetical protein ACWDOR_21455 [Streptosporangium canum]